jgi:hypothetical protein
MRKKIALAEDDVSFHRRKKNEKKDDEVSSTAWTRWLSLVGIPED